MLERGGCLDIVETSEQTRLPVPRSDVSSLSLVVTAAAHGLVLREHAQLVGTTNRTKKNTKVEKAHSTSRWGKFEPIF